RAAALADKDWFGIVKLTGTERVPWLQGMLTNDVEKLPSGSGCYAAHLTPQGKIVAHMQVLVDDDAVWLCLECAVVPNLLAAFDELLIMEDVQMFDVSEEYSILAIIGPKAAAALESWIDEPLTIAGKYAHRKIDDSRIVVSDLGYDVWVPRGRADKVLRFLAQSGATPIDYGTWDELPKLKRHIRKAGREVGYLTTTLCSPGLNKPIALGFVTRTAYGSGSEVEVVSNEKALPAVIVDLPFRL